MRARMGVVGVVILLLIAVMGVEPVAAVVKTSSGGVYVATLPNGADVWIDGTYCGRSPVLVDALVRGRHGITLTKTDWNVQEAWVDIPGGGITVWSTKLSAGARRPWEKGSGGIVVRGLSHHVKVGIDAGPPRELHGITMLVEGPHTISFPTTRGLVMRSFTVLPEMTSELVLREAPVATSHVGVIAPALDYLPPEAIALHSRTLVIRYLNHQVTARLDQDWMRLDGASVSYNSAPSLINGKLYLPLDLLEVLTK